MTKLFESRAAVLEYEARERVLTKEIELKKLQRLEAINAQLLEALESASNYVDNLGGVSQRYRQVIQAAKEQA